MSFPIPKSGEVQFDIIRKKKVIGSHIIQFFDNENELLVKTTININVKILFIPAYKFFHNSTETWVDEEFIKIDAYTDFEDEREYFIKGYDEDEFFYASGMDGDLKLDKHIIPSNFWNFEILKEKEVFDTQKGIVRTIEVEEVGSDEVIINNNKIKCLKFTLNASTNPKDKGPFPKYTLWYDLNKELVKLKFINWKDNKVITLIRNYDKN